MIDTNQIQQAGEVASAVQAQVKANWPMICLVAAFLVREVCKVNGWLEYVCGKIIAHGGLGWIVKKLLWNPKADDVKRS